MPPARPILSTRNRARRIDRSVDTTVVTLLSVAGPPLLRATDAAGLLPDVATALMATVGLGLVIAAKFTLGRSFGIVPANRGVVVSGPYTFVRHPIYTGYLLTHVGFVLAHPQFANMSLVLVSDIALVIRARYEERALRHDPRYRDYCAQVR